MRKTLAIVGLSTMFFVPSFTVAYGLHHRTSAQFYAQSYYSDKNNTAKDSDKKIDDKNEKQKEPRISPADENYGTYAKENKGGKILTRMPAPFEAKTKTLYDGFLNGATVKYQRYEISLFKKRIKERDVTTLMIAYDDGRKYFFIDKQVDGVVDEVTTNDPAITRTKLQDLHNHTIEQLAEYITEEEKPLGKVCVGKHEHERCYIVWENKTNTEETTDSERRETTEETYDIINEGTDFYKIMEQYNNEE